MAEEAKLAPAPLFLDTRTMIRHAGADMPPIMPLPVLATSPAMLSARADWAAEEHTAIRTTAQDKDVALLTAYEEAGAVSTQAGVARQTVGADTLWVGGRHDRQLPYGDGADVRVNSGYDRINTQMALSAHPNDQSRVSLFAMRDLLADNRLPNYGLDVPSFTRWGGSAVAETRFNDGPFQKAEFSTTASLIDYNADNYTLRDRPSLGLGQTGRWATYRSQIQGEFTTGPFANTVSLDGNLQSYDARVYNHFSSEGLSSYRLPKVTVLRSGLGIASSVAPVTGDLLMGGLRLDMAHSSPEAANDLPTVSGTGASAYTISPRSLWQRYYGGGQSVTPTDITLSGKLRYEHPLDSTARIYAEAGRMVRIPEAGERFYANGGPTALVQVGNPGLKPEEHHRGELGAERSGANWQGYFAPSTQPGSTRLLASGWYDRVSNFITVDRARGQTGIFLSDRAIIYRNVDAYLTGASMAGWWQISEGIGARARISWSQGGNLSDGRPLYQVPPLEGEAVIEHRRPVWDMGSASIGLRLGFAASQRQVDSSTLTGSGEDTGGKSPGFALLDLFTNLTMGDGLGLSAGIGNLLDKRYHQHLNPFPQGPTTQVQRAPGRSLYIMTSVTF